MKMKQIVKWFIALTLFIGAISAVAAPAEWVVKNAPVRFVVELTTKPSHSSAGYFVKVPDGGVLPGPKPQSVVVDESGKPLKSGILWHCKDTECALVFEAPSSGNSVTIYFRGGKALNLWTPESGITPGALVCELNGTRSRSAAQKLGDLGTVSSRTRIVNQGWNYGTYDGKALPLATWEWRLGGNAVYILSYIDVTDPGPIWVAPFRRGGELDIFIDGKEVKQKKKNDKVGGIGQTVNLSKGLHRVDLYAYDSKDKVTGPVMFTWRTPKTTIEQLGGKREKEHKYPGTSMNESCVPELENIVRSGECKIVDVAAQTGPVAAFLYKPKSVFWLGDEVPMIAYSFKSASKSNPEGTRYSWRLQQNSEASAEGAEMHWLMKAGRFTKVSLIAEEGKKRSVASYVIYPHTDIESSMDDPETRYNFKLACYDMLKAYPDNVDPTADWGDEMWNNFFRVLELKGGNALLEYVVTHRWDFIKKKLDPKRKALIQDIFLFSMTTRKPKEAFKWATKFANSEFTTARSAVLKLKKAELLMYYMDDLDGAKRIIAPLLRDSGEGGEWAKIRMGDVEFLSGNLNEATQRYGDVQSRSKAISEEVLSKTLSSLTPESKKRLAQKKEPVYEVMGKELESVKAERRKNKDKVEVPNMYIPMEAPSSVPAWKIAAIRDVAASENISMLIDQGFYLEAYRDLRMWERALPMSKISGDLLLREANLYVALKDYKRARKILSAYCEQVDVSNFLPEAMSIIKRCMIEMKESDAVIQKYEDEVMKRTVFGVNQDN